MKILIALVFAVLAVGCPRDTHGQVLGQDYLALQQKNFQEAKAALYLPKRVAIGSLSTTFGNDLTPIRNLLTQSNPLYYRVHLTNNTCIRNKNCGSYEIGYGYTKESFNTALERKDKKIINYLKAQAGIYRMLADEYPNTKFLISPFLEHDLSTRAYRNGADAVISVYPSVQLVNSPDGGITIERYRGSYIERHGNKPQGDADIVSLDGVGASDIDINAFLSRCKKAKVALIWERQYNCRTNSATWVDPRARTACPTSGIFEELAHITDDRGVAPKFTGRGCSNIISFASPNIFKPMAEDTGNGDTRANKPVAIITFNGSVMEVLASNGNKVGTLGYYGTFGSTQRRYYSGYRGGSNINGYGFEKAAKSTSGSPYNWLKVGTKCAGPVITGRRNGLYK